MGKLTLRCGDEVTLVKHHDDGSNEVLTLTIVNMKSSFKGYNILIQNSTLHKYLEKVGIKPTKKQKIAALKIFPKNQRKYFSKIELLEIKKRDKWYITILRKLVFWKKT